MLRRTLLFGLLLSAALSVGCDDAPPEIGEVYRLQAPGLDIQGPVTALGACGALADEEVNNGDLVGAALMPQPEDPATPCASLLVQMPGQQIAYIVPLDHLQDEGFWRKIEAAP